MRAAAAVAAALLLNACATAGTPAPVIPVQGYLDAATVDAIAAGFAPSSPSPSAWPDDLPPEHGPGTDRWWLATAHAELRPPEAAQHFDCVLGARLMERPRPALTRLMTRLLVDADAVTRILSEAHPRRRPIAVDPGLEPCQRTNDATRDAPSWPAGGAVVGAVYGEMFAALAPDEAPKLQARGVQVADSRVVCRMNWPGDVDDGLLVGRAVFEHAAMRPGFAADLEAARVEIAAARAEGLTNPGCAAERRALRRLGY